MSRKAIEWNSPERKESDMRLEPSATPQPFSEREIKSIDAALAKRLLATGNR